MDEQSKPQVLVIEDEKLLREAIVKKLQMAGYTVVETGTGKEALDLLQKTQVLPGVIWLDFYLPDINGMEFVQRIKQDQRLAGIPIVVVSNSASPDVVGKMLDLGVQEYLLKVDKKLEDIIKIVGRYAKK